MKIQTTRILLQFFEMHIVYNGKVWEVIAEIGNYVRFVDAIGSVRMVHRKYLTTRMEGNTYYEYDGKGLVLYDYNKSDRDIAVWKEFSRQDIHH